MLHDDYQWPVQVREYGRFLGCQPLFPVRIEIGIITDGEGHDQKCAIGLCVHDEETVAITPEVAQRLSDDLRSMIDEFDAFTRKRDEQRQLSARRLVDSAVLAHAQWVEVLDGIASDDPAYRDRAVQALRDCAPRTWRTARQNSDAATRGHGKKANR